mmetsp:Transcript_60909/g.108158  ORF Transcript_60909/g.108158 Transcript_60909/m.108158 type:complete len:446 (+) Transcript_60909:100-1437(+)
MVRGLAKMRCCMAAALLAVLQCQWNKRATNFGITVHHVSRPRPIQSSKHGRGPSTVKDWAICSLSFSLMICLRPATSAAKVRRRALGVAPPDILCAADWNVFGKDAGLRVGSPPGTCSDLQELDFSTMQQQMRHDGYSKLKQEDWSNGGHLTSLDAGIGLLEAAGLPEQFLLVFDEAWDVANSVSQTLEPIFGLKNNMDFFVFNVRPGKFGWNLHRDRPEGKLGLAEDGTPEYTTVWIAITDASPETSCIYVLPAHADPEYRTMSGSKYDKQVVAFALQHVRALPVESGTVLTWSHRLLHWGSAAPEAAAQARRTLTFAMAAPGYEQPLLDVQAGQRPSFEARLTLIAYTLICYHHSQPVPLNMQPLLIEIMQRHSEHLTVAAIVQQTGESLFRNMLAFCEMGGQTEMIAVEDAGDKMLSRFGMKTDWWHAECSAKRAKLPAREE